MRKHWAALAATTALLICLPASPAQAHEGNPDYRSVIDEVRRRQSDDDHGSEPVEEAW